MERTGQAHRHPRSPAAHLSPPPPARPVLASDVPQFILLEREVEAEFRPQILEKLQGKVDALAASQDNQVPNCPNCGKAMRYHDQRPVSWLTRFGRVRARPSRYRCPPCNLESRPLLDGLGVEPGRISGSLARLLALLGVVVPYELAARLAWLLLGVTISPMGIWRVLQRLGEAAGRYNEGLSAYHADSRSEARAMARAPDAVVLGVDGCQLGMQVHPQRRRRKTSEEKPPPLPKVEEGQFREVKTGVLLVPAERVEPSPGRRSVGRRFLVTCLGDADALFSHLWAQLRELGWLGTQTVVVIIGDGAEWIWKRAALFERRCEILDFWHALEKAWEFARLQYGAGSKRADAWVHRMGQDLRQGKVEQVIARLKRLCPGSPESREKLDELIRYYTHNAQRMRYDEYLRLGYGIGSGAVESAHKQVVHARLRQAGMRWSEAGARRLLALRLLLLNDNWARLDRLGMVSLGASG
jgi:hypothetical protein